MHKAAIDSCSWDYNYTDWGKSWYKEWMLTDEAKRIRRQQISQYEAKIREIKAKKAAKEAAEKAEKERIAREEAQKRFNEYWEAHAEEKKSLQAERENLKAQINSLNTNLNDQVAEINKEIAAIPGGAEIANLDERINKLTSDKKALGLFKGKEKKAIQEQIDQLTSEKAAIQSRMAAAKKELEAKIAAAKADVQKKVAPMQSRVTAINNELTKAR